MTEPERGDGLQTAFNERPLLSVVVPVKNEEAAIAAFIERTSIVLTSIDEESWEIVFVDDGSTDSTLELIVQANRVDSRVRGISLSRNFGKEAALSAGLDFSTGQAVIPMDVDMQDPPEAMVEMVKRWRQGYKVVYGVRKSRQSDGVAKRVSASLYYRAHNFVSTTKIPEHAGDFRLLDRRVVDIIKQMPERNRFMKGLFAWSGFKQTFVEYDRVPRVAGTTKFNYWKLWTLALDGITSSSTVPLRVWSYVGGCIAFIALLYALFIMVRTLIYGNDVAGYPSLIVAVLFMGGLQLISLGVLGEYVGRIFVESKQRPLYVVGAIVGALE